MAIIQSGLNDCEQNEAALTGLAQLAPIIARYAEIESIYLHTKLAALIEHFRESLVVLYTSILKY